MASKNTTSPNHLEHNGPAGEANADTIKERGNVFFAAGKYQEAFARYMEAIRLCPTSAIYYNNAATALFRLGDFPHAIEMATQSIQLDSTFIKAYYRRAICLMAQNDWEAALEDLKKVSRAIPSDSEARDRLQECRRQLQCAAFAKAIHVDEFVLDAEHIAQLEEPSETYQGPRLSSDGSPISVGFVKEMILWFKEEHLLPFKYACRILMESKRALSATPNVVPITIEPSQQLNICGDIHGQFFDLAQIFTLFGSPGADQKLAYLFNGDFVDRGAYSVEVALTLLAFKAALPNTFFLARGNHESRVVNRMHGFYEEVCRKYDERMFKLFNEVFDTLPLGHIVNQKIFVVHGGLPEGAEKLTIEDVNRLNRFGTPQNGTLMSQLLWSDPQDAAGISPSHRGEGILFGPDVTAKFLDRNGLTHLVRSHVWEYEGYREQHDGRCITIFSAPNYTGSVSDGALIKLDSALKMEFARFEASQYQGSARRPRPAMPLGGMYY